MGKHDHYTAQQFIKAIPGSGGIISVIAQRVGCAWHTAKKYVEGYATVNQVYQDEIELITDLAESVVIGNIRWSYEKQRQSKEQVDSGDAKWFLTRKGKGRGYVERQEVMALNVNVTELSDEQLRRIADGEEPASVLAPPGAGRTGAEA